MRSSKRRRVSPKKSEKTLTAPIETPLEKAIRPVFVALADYLSINDTAHLSSISKICNLLVKSPSTWRQLYIRDFGELYYAGDYQAQYQAARYLKLANSIRQVFYGKVFEKLGKHLEYYQGKPWTFYYLAKLRCHGSIENPTHSTVGYGLESLKSGDLRAHEFLLEKYITSRGFVSNQHYTLTEIDTHLEILQLHLQTHPKFRHDICLLNCAKSIHDSASAEQQRQFQEIALTQFFDEWLKEEPQKIVFIEFLSKFISALGHFFWEDHLEDLPNALEIMMSASVLDAIENDFPFLKKLETWVKDLADKGLAPAAFHYAKQFLAKQNKHVITKIYYLQAIQGGDYRAALELDVDDAMRIPYLKKGALNNSTECLDALKQIEGWENDSEILWIFLDYVIKNEIQKPQVEQPIALLIGALQMRYPGHVFLNCAYTLALFHEFEFRRQSPLPLSKHAGESKDFAHKHHALATAKNPNAFKIFFAVGEKLGLCTDKHKECIKQLEDKPKRQTRFFDRKLASYSQKIPEFKVGLGL